MWWLQRHSCHSLFNKRLLRLHLAKTKKIGNGFRYRKNSCLSVTNLAISSWEIKKKSHQNRSKKVTVWIETTWCGDKNQNRVRLFFFFDDFQTSSLYKIKEWQIIVCFRVFQRCTYLRFWKHGNVRRTDVLKKIHGQEDIIEWKTVAYWLIHFFLCSVFGLLSSMVFQNLWPPILVRHLRK